MPEGLQKMHGCLEMSEDTEGLRTEKGEEKGMMSKVTCLGFCLLRVDKTRSFYSFLRRGMKGTNHKML